jgi:hypothetical protein
MMFRVRSVDRRFVVAGVPLRLWPAVAAAQNERSTSPFVFGGAGGVTPDDVHVPARANAASRCRALFPNGPVGHLLSGVG